MGPIVIAGKLLGNCVPLRVRGYDDLTITGIVSNACSDTLAPAFPKLQILTDGALTLDGAEVTSSGGIEVGNDSTAAAVLLRAGNRARAAVGLHRTEGDPCNLATSFIGPDPINARSGAAGSPRGGNGLAGNPTELKCAGNARLSFVKIWGQNGGRGGPGTSTASEGAIGGIGGRGGDALVSATGDLEFVLSNEIVSGLGGKGGSASNLEGGKAEGQGGDGGNSGRPFGFAKGQTRVTGSVELKIGTPGWGGGASIEGRPGADATPTQAARPGEDAVGRGGNAGNIGSSAAPLRVLGDLLPNAVGNVAKVQVTADASLLAFGGPAFVKGGRGGAGNAPFPNGAAGGLSHGEGGRGANVFVLDNRAGETWIGKPGDGGNIHLVDGGRGGSGFNDCVPGALQPGGRGGAGGIAFGTTGRAGASGSGANGADGDFIYAFLNIGGAGGDGMPLGRGGAGGRHEVEVLGQIKGDEASFKPGADGNGCPFGALIELRPTQLSADHTVGGTACPQALGMVDLVNTGQSNIAWTATRGQNGTAIDFAPASGTLAAGATAPITLAFNCSAPRSVQTSLGFEAQPQGGSGTAQANLNVTVNVFADAVTLDSPLGSFTAGTVILLSRTQNARLANPDACPAVHVHAQTLEGIRIDGLGPFTDPNPTQCGYGRVSKARVPEATGQANRITAGLPGLVLSHRFQGGSSPFLRSGFSR